MLKFNKDFIFYGIVLTLSVFSIIYCFSVVGSPSQRKAASLDQTRISQLTSLSFKINSFSFTSKRLPVTSSEIIGFNDTVDPATATPYTYELLTDVDYQLCATFSTASTNDNITGKNHRQGYDCLKFSVTNY